MAERITLDRDRIKYVMTRAVSGRNNNEGIFAEEIEPPEKDFIALARNYGKRIGNESYPLHAVFFLTSTLFADDSTRQLKLASRPEVFTENAWVFDPKTVVETEEEKVIAAARDLIRPGYNGVALERWHHNASVIENHYGGSLENFFTKYEYDAPKILNALIGPAKKNGWDGFHRFRQKLGCLFLQWADTYNLASRKLERIDDIGIPVDFQAIRIMAQTGGITLLEPIHKGEVIKSLTENLPGICRETGYPSQQISETLWLIGNNCCNNFNHQDCPLQDECTILLSRKKFDDAGIVDPKDTGRYWKTRKEMVAEGRRSKAIDRGQEFFFLDDPELMNK